MDVVAGDSPTIAFLARRLHVDLNLYPEYQGSLALVVPDPVLRSVEHFVAPHQDGSGAERMVIRLIPIALDSLTDMSITLVEQQSNLLTKVETRRVPKDGLVVIESPTTVSASGYTLIDPAQVNLG